MGGSQSAGECPANTFACPYSKGKSDDVIVDTSKGKVKGFRKKENGPVHFRGIPTAAPVSGENRWKAPQPRAAWEGVHDGTTYAEAVTQNATTGTAGLFGRGHKCDNDQGRMGDDCLAIDIISNDVGGSLPVMVFIHGGANKMGSPKGDAAAMVPMTDAFASQGVVICAISYRHGMHGFLHLPEEGVTNLALRDLINHLQWVQDEIAAFGGDKNNVTVFGESSGGINTTHLASSPAAQNLFHRAIVQSGGPTGNVNAQEYKDIVLPAYKAAIMPILAKKGQTEFNKKALESLTAEDVKACTNAAPNPIEKENGVNKCPDPFYIYIGDDIMPTHPNEQMKNGVCTGKHIMWGCNSFEPAFVVNLAGAAIAGIAAYRMIFPCYLRGAEKYTIGEEANMPKNCSTEARTRLIARHQALIDKATGSKNASWTGATAKDGLMMALQQLWFTNPICGEWIEAAAANNNVYQYTLNLTEEECPAGNFHGLDLILLGKPDEPEYETWQNGGFGRADSARIPSADKVGQGMVTCWTNFGKTGSPGEFLGLEWPKYPQMMMLQSTPEARISSLNEASDVVKLYNMTMEECGINPRKGADYTIPPMGGADHGADTVGCGGW